MLCPYPQHVVLWFLILIVVQASSALRGGSSSQNGRILSSNIGPNRTWATHRFFSSRNVLSTLRKKQEHVQQACGPPTSSLVARRIKSRTTALHAAEIPSDDKKNDDDVDVDVDWRKLGHDRLGEVLYGKVGASVNSITGKNKKDAPAYQFGDLTRWVDRETRTRVGGFWYTSSKNETASQMQSNVNSMKQEQQQQQQHKKPLIDLRPFQNLYTKFGDRVNSVTGKKDPYEFGDLTRWLEAEVRSEVKEVESEVKGFYKVAREIRGAKRRRTFMEDEDGKNDQVSDLMNVAFGVFAVFRSITLVSIIRLVLKLGIERPVLRRLPTIILMELVHLILDGDYRPLILRVVAMELDKRFKIAIIGDEDYQFGDLTRRTVSKFTGKNQYEFGDITKHILERAEARKTSSAAYSEKATATYKDQNQKELDVLEEDVRSYQFGDLTKKAVSRFTGKDKYVFGDITKRVLEQRQAAEKAAARNKDQVQEELHLEDDKSLSLRRQGSRIPTLRWFRK
jgi:hypothetical protein